MSNKAFFSFIGIATPLSVLLGIVAVPLIMGSSTDTLKAKEVTAMTCDSDMFFKAKEDCRRTFVDKHYDIYKSDRELLRGVIRHHCDIIATSFYCEEIR